MRLLVEAGAGRDVQGHSGDTALSVASRHLRSGHAEIVRLLEGPC